MIIGITGGIGSGKTSVLQILKTEYDAIIIQADIVAKEIRARGMPAYNEIVKFLGSSILNRDGTINNDVVADIVFNDKSKLEKINSIIHPLVRDEIERRIEFEKSHNLSAYILIEAALFIEAGYMDMCDKLWYVYCDTDTRKKRLYSERGYSIEKSEQIIRSQLPDEIYFKYADDVVNNSGTLDETHRQIVEILGKYKSDKNI
ncbi:MAG: dephospho-CoA kinase [Eubacterium sp.]